jgi:hypothetical protein
MPISSIFARSSPVILIPTGVRIPVDSMSMRALIGIVQALDSPGRRSASFISETRPSVEMWSAVMVRKAGFSHSGAHDEYQVGTLRHADFGFKVTTVSSIESGAGSVGVSARPAFPRTWSTSGKLLMIRSVTWRSLCASVIEMPGIVVGMKNSASSSRGGMNSEPSERKTGTVETTSSTAIAITVHLYRSDQAATGP